MQVILELFNEMPLATIIYLVIVAAVFVILFVRTMQTIGLERIRKYVYQLFVDAEKEFEHGKNEEKFEYVVNLAKMAIPAPFNLIITESLLRRMVQAWFDICKDLLDDGKLNGTGKREE